MSGAELRAGVDVGATSADAVLVDERGRLVSRAKVPVHATLRDSIAAALDALPCPGPDGGGAPARVMLATHAITDDLEHRRALTRVGVLRLGGPLTGALPPLSGWPSDLRAAVSAGERIVGGGTDHDGWTATPLDVEAVLRFLEAVAGDAGAIAVTSVFAPVAPEQELEVVALVRRELGAGVAVTPSQEVGSIGLVARENASVLNATLAGPAEHLAAALTGALAARGMAAESFFAQNDGTIMVFEHALRFPVLMIDGDTGVSIRGAAQLSGVADATVVDVGGSHTEVSVLVHGFPRQATPPTEVAGVSSDFRVPERWSLPVGGRTDAPDRAAALGWELADVDVLDDDPEQPGRPIIAVGGAAELVAQALTGGEEVIRPAYGDVAGAFGAATAAVSGHADVVCAADPQRLEAATDQVSGEAIERAIHAGADPARVEVVDVEQVPLGHLVEPAFRLRARAVGPCA
ncbi:MAG TPA: hydantoinase/oxoprolinase N-terminal domain-containing protein [Baekduia sp.]|jgi:N-methylhydantoinase A/oxoprolinase/acetone carboxylase beta subunit